MSNINNIPKVRMEQAVALSITFRCAGDKRDGDMDEVTTSADKNMCRMVKKLFGGKGDAEGKDDSKCKEYDAIVSFDGKTRRWITSQTVPLLGRRNVYLMSVDGVVKVNAALENAAKERELLVKAFLNVYPVVVEAAKSKLNGQYRDSDYPSVDSLAKKFGMDWNYLQLGVPENLPAEIRAAMVEKTTKMWESAGEQIRDSLRMGFVQMVEHLVAMLQPTADGKLKKFHDSNVEHILDFIDTLSQRDLTNDTGLQSIAAQAKKLIEESCTDIKKVKTDATTKKAVVDGFNAIKESMNLMIGTEKRRKFDLE